MNPSFLPFPEGGRWLWRRFTGVIRSGTTVFNRSIMALIADADERNIDVALVPKGTGALVLTVPDGAIAGGNARGANAVDLQKSRTQATQVASGDKSFAAGGSNTPSGSYATCPGGDGNTASGTGAGTTNGLQNQANGAFSRAGGVHAIVNVQGADAYSAGQFGAAGDNQRCDYVLRRQTTDATPSELTATGGSSSAISQPTLANDATYAFSALIVARRTDVNDESAAYKIEGCIDRNSGAATTALVGTPVVTVLSEDSAAWDVSAVADTTNGGLKIIATGEAGKTIRWVARVATVEVTG